MAKNCFVPNCRNKSTNCNKIFLSIPRDWEKRKLWFAAVGKENVPKGGGRYHCCEDHFDCPNDIVNYRELQLVGGTRCQLREGVIPHLHLGPLVQQQGEPTKKKIEEVIPPQNLGPLVELQREPIKRKIQKINVAGPSKLIKPSVSHLAEVVTSSSFSTIHTSSSSTIPTESVSSSDEDLLEEEYIMMMEKRRQTTFFIIEKNSKFYLGLPNYVYNLTKFITETATIPYRDVLICLKKVHLNDVYFRLALDFGLSDTRIQQIFRNGVPKIANVLQNFIFFPTHQQIKLLLPIPFRYRYSNVKFIIDCFEIEIQKPSNPIHQSQSWSEYKKCNTIKYLISGTPNGFINFISKGYGGRITDTNLVKVSGFANKIENCDIMADRGFKNIDEILNRTNCKLVRPPSVSEGTKLTPTEVRRAKQIAALRIHIERLIKRIREFKMVDIHSRVDLNYLSTIDEIIIIVCAIVNTQGPLIN